MKNDKTMTKKTKAQNDNFAPGEYVVHPKHGVGKIEEVVTLTGVEGRFYKVNYEKDRMRVHIPVMKAEGVGLRKLSTADLLADAMATLRDKSKVRRTMWSRRAAEYETKINSGDPVAIAEVLRDLKRSNDDDEKSYSERQIYQSALERLAREVAIVKKITEDKAVEELEAIMIPKSRVGKNANSNEQKAA